jgi:hypothetical protein
MPQSSIVPPCNISFGGPVAGNKMKKKKYHTVEKVPKIQ